MTSLATTTVKKDLLNFIKTQKPTDKESKNYLKFCISTLEREINKEPDKSYEYMEDEELLLKLPEFGFTGPQCRIICYLITSGVPTSVTDVSKKTKITRTMVYFLVHNLQKRGFILSSVTLPLKITIIPDFFSKIIQEIENNAMEKTAKVKELEAYCAKYKMVES